MLVIKRKNLVMGILVVLLIVTGYLNFAYNQNAMDGEYDAENASKDVEENTGDGLDEIQVSDAGALEGTVLPEDSDFGESLTAGSSSFFRDFRFERESTRNEEIDYINDIVENPKSDPDMKKEAQAQLLEITQCMEKEITIEGVLKARGFNDAVVIIHPKSVNVIVDKTELDPEEVAQILTTVQRETGEKAANITIIPKI